ncbi:MAG: hypothetical protein IKQ82_06075 [Lentisphaeria bacterium]|nr:hypothetical protein [Lentisphaeria bacterium]
MFKTLAFTFIFLYFVPFMTAMCCLFPKLRHFFFACMLYFTSREVTLNILPLPDWRGTARGYAFSMVSLFALPLLLSMICSFRYKVRLFPPGLFFYFLYFLAILLSGYNAVHMHQWGFEVNKMFWMYITFLTAFNYFNNSRNLNYFIYLVCIILIYLFLVGLNQKYREGRFQIASTFPHQNSLCLYLELFGLMVLGVLMNEDLSKLLFFLCLAASGSSVLLIIFTYSRGGLVLYFGGIAIVCSLSIIINGFSVRRLMLMLIGLLVMLCIIGYALPRIITRFTKAPEMSKNTRIYLALAARRMANDYRLGVGANNFSEFSGGFDKYNYTVEQYAGGIPEFGGIVETIYLLVAAECGWWGLGTLLLWFLYYYFLCFFNVIFLRKYPCSGISIGLLGGLTILYAHSTLEWSLKQYNNFAEQMIVYALIGVIAVNRKNIRAAYQRSQLRKQPAATPPPPSPSGPELPSPRPELPPPSGMDQPGSEPGSQAPATV